jgi:hypothetical protein
MVIKNWSLRSAFRVGKIQMDTVHPMSGSGMGFFPAAISGIS